MSGDSSIDWPLTIGAVAAGFVTVVSAIARGIKWLYARADRREAAQEAREIAYTKKIEQKLEVFEARLEDLWTCFSLVATALHETSPGHSALVRASKILGKAFPINFDVPDDMMEVINRIDAHKMNGGGEAGA